jgi:hypothetical protein
MHPFETKYAVFEDLIPGCSEVNMAGGVGRAIDKKPCFSIPVLLLYPGINLLFRPEFLDRGFNFPGCKTAGYLSHSISSKIPYIIGCTCR